MARRRMAAEAGRGAAGFTLVEILLVVTIMAVSLGVAIPNLARSYKGARLRRSGRTVQMMHRQAKSKAVLGQNYAALFFDEVKGTVELVSVGGGGGGGKDAFFGDTGTGGGEGAGGNGVGEGSFGGDGEGTPEVRSEQTAKLEEGVEMASFKGGAEVDGVHYVQYYPNGMCQAWSLELRDEGGRGLSVSVDPVTGKVESAEHD